jgi:hypothetical protein
VDGDAVWMSRCSATSTMPFGSTVRVTRARSTVTFAAAAEAGPARTIAVATSASLLTRA